MKLPLLITGLFVWGCGCAQVKIGDISIDEKTAQKYFEDCYSHPDTLTTKTESDFDGHPTCNGCWFSFTYEQRDMWRKDATDYNSNLLKNAIGQAYDTVFTPLHYDTIYNKSAYGFIYSQQDKENVDSIMAAHKIAEIKSGVKEVIKMEAKTRIIWLGYLIPRKPSEIDFIKWLHSQAPKTN